MRSQYGKAFQNILTREIECFSYDPQQNYYDVVQDAVKGDTSKVFLLLL